jgi:hypothetical protein
MAAFIVAAMDPDSGGADARISPKVIFLLAFHGSILPRSLAGLNRIQREELLRGREKETGAGVRRSAGSPCANRGLDRTSAARWIGSRLNFVSSRSGVVG